MASRFLRTLFLGITAIALAAAPSYSQGKGHGKGHEKHGDDDEGAGKYAFSARDREVVAGYFSNHASSGFIGAHLVIFNKNTNVIVDVMKNLY